MKLFFVSAFVSADTLGGGVNYYVLKGGGFCALLVPTLYQ